MKKNMGGSDRTIRLIVAAVILGLYAMGYISGTLSIILIVVAAIFALTSVINFCPLYAVFGFNTCKVKDAK
jgi:hypothetical protein